MSERFVRVDGGGSALKTSPAPYTGTSSYHGVQDTGVLLHLNRGLLQGLYCILGTERFVYG